MFCQIPGKLSDEHVWPQWLRSFPAYDALLEQHPPSDDPSWKVRLEPDDRGRFVARRYQRGQEQLLPHVQIRQVCTTCNTGWLSRLEKDVKRLLAPMIREQPLCLTPEGRQMLALWVLKTSMMYALHQPPEARIFPSAAYTMLYANRDETSYQQRPLPGSPAIWIGRSNASTAHIAMGLAPLLFAPNHTRGEDLASMPATAGDIYLAAHGVFFIHHYWPDEFESLREEFVLPMPMRAGLQQLWPPRTPIRWPLPLISESQLDRAKGWLSRVTALIGFGVVGHTPAELEELQEDLFSGSDPGALCMRSVRQRYAPRGSRGGG